MNVAAVMDQLAVQLRTIDSLTGRTYAYPAPGVAPPAAMVGWPDPIAFDGTMLRGMDTITFPVLVAVGKADVRSSRDALGAYLDGAGSSSLKAALDGRRNKYTACDSVNVTEIRVEPVTIAGIEYLAAILAVEVTGTGGA